MGRRRFVGDHRRQSSRSLVDQPSGGRRFVPAYTTIGQSTDIFCNVGDKVRWALA
jgi:hypothetical protein